MVFDPLFARRMMRNTSSQTQVLLDPVHETRGKLLAAAMHRQHRFLLTESHNQVLAATRLEGASLLL